MEVSFGSNAGDALRRCQADPCVKIEWFTGDGIVEQLLADQLKGYCTYRFSDIKLLLTSCK